MLRSTLAIARTQSRHGRRRGRRRRRRRLVLKNQRRRASIVDSRVRLDSTREFAPSRDVFMIIVYSRDLVGVVDPSRSLDLDDSRRVSSSFDAREKNRDARCSSDPVLLNLDDTNERTDERMNRRTVCRSSRRTSRRFDHTPHSALRTNSTLRDVTRNLPSRVRVDVNVPTTRRRVPRRIFARVRIFGPRGARIETRDRVRRDVDDARVN